MTEELKLDPKGYFLIKVENNKIYLAFCNYQDKEGWYDNKIELSHSSENKEELLDWAIHHKLYSQQDHYDYLVKELSRAEKYLKNEGKYIQDDK